MILNMIDYFGSLLEIWYAKEEHIYQALCNHRIIAEKMLKTRNKHEIEAIINRNDKGNFQIKTILDHDYPQNLKDIYNPPYVIYIKGTLCLEKPLVAVVGARKSTAYGRWAARKFSKELSEWGVGIVSGLALGIDAEGHKGALDANGYTIGVLGCGI